MDPSQCLDVDHEALLSNGGATYVYARKDPRRFNSIVVLLNNSSHRYDGDGVNQRLDILIHPYLALPSTTGDPFEAQAHYYVIFSSLTSDLQPNKYHVICGI